MTAPATDEAIGVTLVTGLLPEPVERIAALRAAQPGSTRDGSVENALRRANHALFEQGEVSWDRPDELLGAIGAGKPAAWQGLAESLHEATARLAPAAETAELIWTDPCGLATFPVWLSLLAGCRTVIVSVPAGRFADEFGGSIGCGGIVDGERLDSWEGRYVLAQTYQAFVADLSRRIRFPDQLEVVDAGAVSPIAGSVAP